MNIYAEEGSKIVYKDETAGYEHDQATAKKYLVLNKAYTIAATRINDWNTYVYLVEVPGVRFNSVLFEEEVAVKDKAKETK